MRHIRIRWLVIGIAALFVAAVAAFAGLRQALVV
jgi:hypothetical protein